MNPNDNDYIVFLPIKENTVYQVDLKSGLFGIYTDEEYERIRPFEKVSNYSTSFSFATMTIAKLYVEKVHEVNGDMTNWEKVYEFEVQNKKNK